MSLPFLLSFKAGLKLFLPGLILLVAIADDLRSRKIHNRLILFLFPIVLGLVFWASGFSGLKAGAISAGLALALAVPLTLGGVIGGGDLKLLFLFAWAVAWLDLFKVFLYALPWALALGLIKTALEGQLKDFFFNIVFMFRYRKTKGLKLHSIPFSVALFAGWLSLLTLQRLSLGF